MLLDRRLTLNPLIAASQPLHAPFLTPQQPIIVTMVLAALATLMLALEAYRHFRPSHYGGMPQPFGIVFAAILVLFWMIRGPRSERAGRIAATLLFSVPLNRQLLPEWLATLLVVASAVYTVWFWSRTGTDRAMVRRAWLSAALALAAFCLVWGLTGC